MMEVIKTTNQFIVPKKTGTYADGLVAIGQADLLRKIETVTGEYRQVTIKDGGDSYYLEVIPGITPEDFERWQPEPGYIYIKVKKDDDDSPLVYYDYEDAQEKEKVYREFQKALDKKKIENTLQMQGLDAPLPPPEDLSVIKTYNSMRMGSNSYNVLHKVLRETEHLSQLVQYKLGMLENIHSSWEKPLKKAASVLQLFNPIAGKGTHRPKPDSASAGSFSDKLADWFEEWMKFKAMHLALLTYPIGDDTKVLVAAPGEITVSDLELIRRELLKQRIYGSVWLDIQAVFHTVRLLIKHSREYSGEQASLSFFEAAPNKVIKGLYSAYFKSLGKASAVMNVSFLALPGWFPIKGKKDAEDWLNIIGEHERCLKSLDESISGDIPILLAYREFLSTGNLSPGLDFFARYGTHFMQRKDQNKWAEAFTIQNVRRLFMAYALGDIIENEGFKNVARAIRRATVNAQLRKAATGKTPFEIQYGLAQQWKRKVKFKDQFIIELSDFCQKYNAESARSMEVGRERRALISDDDLTQVICLIEKHSSELVGMLLLAYGYAKEDKEQTGLSE